MSGDKTDLNCKSLSKSHCVHHNKLQEHPSFSTHVVEHVSPIISSFANCSQRKVPSTTTGGFSKPDIHNNTLSSSVHFSWSARLI